MTTAGSTDYYTRNNEGNLISLRDGGNRYYYLLDGISSVVGLVDTSAAKVNSYSYDPYGKQLTATGTIVNPWRYASGYYDSSTGLTKFGARYYNPDLGRFTQRDPSGKDLPYSYAGCNPTNNTDPEGTCSLDSYLGMIAGFIASFGAAEGTWILAGVASVPFTAGAVIIGTGLAAAAILAFAIGVCIAQDT